MTENQYQAKLIKKIERRFPGCMIVMGDADHQQGIPDLFVLYECVWAALEVKASLRSRRQPNQDHYVNTLNNMSFAAYICPENEAEVLDALAQAFEIAGRACVSKP